MAGKKSWLPEAGVAVSYPLTRLSVFACRGAGCGETTLSLWPPFPPASVMTSVCVQAYPAPLHPTPGRNLPSLLQVSQPRLLLLSFYSPRPGIPKMKLQDPRAERVKSQHLSSRNSYTSEVLDKGAGRQNPGPAGLKDSRVPALHVVGF